MDITRRYGKVPAPHPLASPPIPDRWLLFVIFTVSGGCGLVYEVVWSRMLTLIFGATTLAISTVLSTFMAGLGLGSIVFGRAVQKRIDPLLIYVLLEAAIGIYALFFPFLMNALEKIYINVFDALYEDFYLLSLIRFLVSFAFLFFPTFLMGGTFPVMSQFVVREKRRAGLDIGLLYALNTSGAALGAMATGFSLIPALGMKGCILLSGIGNLSIAIFVFILKNRWKRSIVPGNIRPSIANPGDADFEPPRRKSLSLFLLPAFFLSGFTALGLQVIWTRLLVLSFGTSIYAFTIVLVTFLLGLVIGSMSLSSTVNRTKDPSGLFGWLEIFIGLTTLIGLPLMERLPQFFLDLFKLSGGEWGKLILMEIFLASGIIILPTIAFGATFPAVAKAYSLRLGSIGKGVGDCYGVNTFGAMAGSFLTGFLLVPLMGFQKGLIILASINLIIGASVLFLFLEISFGKRALVLISSLIVTGVAQFAFPMWNQRVLTSGVYIYAQEFLKKGKSVVSAMEDYKLLYYREGLSATVAVLKGKDLFLRVNGKTDAGDSPDNLTQRLLAHLPLLLHPDPRDILVIGLGSGVTLGSALLHPVINVDCIEISPEVVEASHFFKRANYSALDDPRAHIHVLDARTWILAKNSQYDVIISEPSNPWQTGNSNLFTVDHYRLARKRLRDGGIICQWLPYYQMSLHDLKMALNSFYQVFPEGSLWMVSADALMIGQKGEGLSDLRRIKRRWEENQRVRKSLEEIGINDIPTFLSLFLLDKEGIEEFLKSERMIHTDDRPVLEFSAPRSLYQDTALANYREMARYAKTAFPPVKSTDPPSSTFSLLIDLAESYQKVNRLSYAALALSDALKIRPDDPEILYKLGIIKAEMGDIGGAGEEIEKALRLDPANYQAHNDLGLIYVRQRKMNLAEQQFRKALSIRPDLAPAHYNLGQLYLEYHRSYHSALREFQEAQKADPMNPRIWNALGMAHAMLKDYQRAKECWKKAIEIDPSYEKARRNLERLRHVRDSF